MHHPQLKHIFFEKLEESAQNAHTLALKQLHVLISISRIELLGCQKVSDGNPKVKNSLGGNICII